MRSLLPLLSASSLAFESNAGLSLFTRQTAICFILPIAPDPFNGNTACGGGSVVSECMCCPDRTTTCSIALQTCQIGSGGNYVCVDNSFSSGGSDCAAQGLQACGNSCMPVGQTCCASVAAYCPASEVCCTLSDGSGGCCPPDGSTAGSTSPATPTLIPATTPVSAPSTTPDSILSETTPTSTAFSTTESQYISSASASTTVANTAPSGQPTTSASASAFLNPSLRLSFSYMLAAGGVALAATLSLH